MQDMEVHNIDWHCVLSWFLAILVAIVSGPIYVIVAIFGLGLAGFTALGVVGGSLAAATQSGIGLVAAGSWFACFTSIGALGVMGVHPAVFVLCSLINVVCVALIMNYKGCELSTCPCHS
jgi:hypothetical protein